MTQETINKVAELYKKKSQLFEELSILKKEEYSFEIGYLVKDYALSHYGATKYSTLTPEFLREIKLKTEEHIQQQIQEIDKQLEEL